MLKPKRLARSIIYQSKWVNLFADRVEMPTGDIIEQYHIVDFNCDAVGIVLENDKDEIMFVQVYRYPLDKLNWEIPSGRIDSGEDILHAAQREAFEESGYESYGHKHFYEYYPIDGVSNHKFYAVSCHAGKRVGEPDPLEIADTKWIHKDEVKNMIRRGEIIDGFSLTLLLLYLCDLN